jgi:hypothetical protein
VQHTSDNRLNATGRDTGNVCHQDPQKAGLLDRERNCVLGDDGVDRIGAEPAAATARPCHPKVPSDLGLRLARAIQASSAGAEKQAELALIDA